MRVWFDTLPRALTETFGQIVDDLIADAMLGDGDATTLDSRRPAGLDDAADKERRRRDRRQRISGG